MDQKERDTQRALGNMEEFRVTVIIPIKIGVRMIQNVEAVNEKDAIEKMKMIQDIMSNGSLLRNVLSEVKTGYSYKTEFDTSVDREYTAEIIHKPKSMISPESDCEGECESPA